MRFSLLAVAVLLAGSCKQAPPTEATSTPGPPAAASLSIDPAKLVDLTYSYNAQTVYWPNAKGFRHQKDTWAKTDKGFWYAAGEFASAEHGGTHMDSPIHFAQGKLTLDQIPVSRFVGPAAVIDLSKRAAEDPDYLATLNDLLTWENTNGLIEEGSIVIFRMGWGARWPDRKKYLGSDVPGDITHLHFPGISRDAADALVMRRVSGVGIDTASLDYGPSIDFPVHQILNSANVYGLENIANAQALPATGATIIALPMKIEDGSGGPVRIVALLP